MVTLRTDTGPSITYQGSWVNESRQGTYNNDDHYSNVTNDSFTITFNGTQIAWYGAKGSAKGTAAVSIDGGAETTVDTSANSDAETQLLFTSPQLNVGTHTLKVRVLGTGYIIADKFTITQSFNSNGKYKIINSNSSKLLDVYGASTVDGRTVNQWTDNGGLNQQWSIVDLNNGYFKIVNKNSGKVLEVNGGSTADGGVVDQWTYNGGANQQWNIVEQP
ncbi:RICIN domain-containing protein [Paenibacillus sp. Soil787]|uniref:RICIN domain-containing protein n=1 Tax=Paenibacillus sp. Soil787 TaxID=1736411 RepID=UPI0006FE1BA7|nr:RICIN domain-containing protein [Paenibacillus sp. Soil787]KRF43556.1 hypothetical protein ASG93_01130 [Paenibacillus sp. Soil787]